MRGYLTEGRERLTELLAHKGASAPTAARAEVLRAAGVLAYEQGDFAAARAVYEESLATRRLIGDQRGIALSLNELAILLRDQGDFRAARALYDEGLAITRESGSESVMAHLLNGAAILESMQGHYSDARPLFEESLGVFRKLGNTRSAAHALNNLGTVLELQGDRAAALGLFEEALGAFRGLEDRQGVAMSLDGLASLALVRGEAVAARSFLNESLEIRSALGDRRGVPGCLEALARSLQHASAAAPERAASLYGAADTLRHSIGSPLPPNERERYDRDIAGAAHSPGGGSLCSGLGEGAGDDPGRGHRLRSGRDECFVSTSAHENRWSDTGRAR